MKIGSSEWTDLIRKGAETFGLVLSDHQIDRFAEHARQLMAWNRRINLTRITDPKDVAVRHYIDSLAPAPWLSHDAKLLDIGSGGGFPGIPLNVAVPTLSVTLIDGVRKKVNFLKTVIRDLDLEGIEAHHLRAEEIIQVNPASARSSYSVVICRALTALDRFVDLALPLLSTGGTLIAMKADISDEERDDLRRYLEGGGASFKIQEKTYRLPFEGSRRTLIRMVHQRNQEG